MLMMMSFSKDPEVTPQPGFDGTQEDPICRFLAMLRVTVAQKTAVISFGKCVSFELKAVSSCNTLRVLLVCCCVRRRSQAAAPLLQGALGAEACVVSCQALAYCELQNN